MERFIVFLQSWVATRDFEHRDRGATMIEYALVVSLIALVAVVAIEPVGNAVKGVFDDIAGALG